MHRIEIYDTTLRDGTQGEGVSLSLEDKLRIATRLDDQGFDFIEGGYPMSNPKDSEFFRQAGCDGFCHDFWGFLSARRIGADYAIADVCLAISAALFSRCERGNSGQIVIYLEDFEL